MMEMPGSRTITIERDSYGNIKGAEVTDG
jgi:hypothetical protein